MKHCIFPDWRPQECVITGERHEHCAATTPAATAPPPSRASFAQHGPLNDRTEMSNDISMESPPPQPAHGTADQIADDDDLSDLLPLCHGLEELSPPAVDFATYYSPESVPHSPMPLWTTSDTVSPPRTEFGSDSLELEGQGLIEPDIAASSCLWTPDVRLHEIPSTPEPPELRY
jgi:hypothetical protein